MSKIETRSRLWRLYGEDFTIRRYSIPWQMNPYNREPAFWPLLAEWSPCRETRVERDEDGLLRCPICGETEGLSVEQVFVLGSLGNVETKRDDKRDDALAVQVFPNHDRNAVSVILRCEIGDHYASIDFGNVDSIDGGVRTGTYQGIPYEPYAAPWANKDDSDDPLGE